METLSIKITSGHIESYEALLLQLDDENDQSIEQVELTFGEVTQVFPSAFALMASYIGRRRNPAKRPLVSRRFGANPQSAKLERIMDAMGFIPAIAGRAAPEPRPKAGIVPLTPIREGVEPDDVARQLIDTICLTAQPTRDAKEMLFVVVTELAENILRHADAGETAFVTAQLSTQKKKIELCVIDGGNGIRKSLEASGDAAIEKRLKAGESPLALALEPGLTSGGNERTGLGLFVASEAARITKGIFRVTSGNETLILSKEGEKYRNHAPWAGTVVNLLINIDKVGSIAEVYRELPLRRSDNERFIRA